MNTSNPPNRVAFFENFSSTEYHLALNREPTGDHLSPQIFETSEGKFALAFDSEEALSDFAGEGAYATLPGRVLAAILSKSGLGLCLNPEHDPNLLVPDDFKWLIEVLARPPMPANPSLYDIQPATNISENLFQAFQRRIKKAPGLAEHAILARADGAPVIAVVGAAEKTQDALAGTLQEALTFSDVSEEWSIAFIAKGSEFEGRLREFGTVIAFPPAETQSSDTRPAPGSDPENPPILR